MALQTRTITATLYKPDGDPAVGATMRATLDRTDVDANGYVFPEVLEFTADANGLVTMTLWPNARGSTESRYRFIAYDATSTEKLLDVFGSVPDSDADLYSFADTPAYAGRPVTTTRTLEGISSDAAAMQMQTSPGYVGAESLPTSIAGELERIRYAVAGHAGTANWYECRTVAQYGSLSALVSHIGASVVTLRLYPEAWPVAADLTIPSNITLECPRGVDIQVASGKTLTFSGKEPIAGLYQFFSGAGSVVFSQGSAVPSRWFGDGGAAIQSAIDAFPSGKGTVLLDGTNTVTSTLTVAQDRIHLKGNGRWGTNLLFAPSAAGTLIQWSKGALVLYQCSISGLTVTSDDTTYLKTAFDVVDTSAFKMEDVVVGPNWNDTATTSCIGLRTRGRESNTYSRVELYTDRPIVIDGNPNAAFLDCDHYHFEDLLILCPTNGASGNHPCVEILDGVNVSNVVFDGRQAWVKGSDGLKWVDTSTIATSQQLSIQNVRWEGSQNASGYLIDIEHNSNLQGLEIKNCSGGLNTLGIKLRNIVRASIRDSFTLNTSGISLDVDTSVDPLVIENLFIQSSGTLSLGGLKRLYDSGPGAMPGFSMALAAFGNQATVTASRIDVPLMGTGGSIAQDATATIGVANDTLGFVFVVTDEDVAAIYLLKGGANATVEVSDATGFFHTVKNNAATYNIYYEAPDYVIQNKRTGAHTVRWLLIGDKT